MSLLQHYPPQKAGPVACWPQEGFARKDTLLFLLRINHSFHVTHEGALHSIQVVSKSLH